MQPALTYFYLQHCIGLFADGSFHTKNFIADFLRLKLNFIKNRFLSHPLGATFIALHPSTARWKACGRLPVRHS